MSDGSDEEWSVAVESSAVDSAASSGFSVLFGAASLLSGPSSVVSVALAESDSEQGASARVKNLQEIDTAGSTCRDIGISFRDGVGGVGSGLLSNTMQQTVVLFSRGTQQIVASLPTEASTAVVVVASAGKF